MTKSLLLGCLLIIVVSARSQYKADSLFDFNKKFTVAELRADLKVLKDSLEIIHPALYRYASKEKFNTAFATAEKQVDRPLTQVQFYGIVAPIISMVGDIHTTIEPSDESLNYLATQSDLFPFDVRIVNKRVYIASNNSSDTSIPVGSRILKINNQPIEKIVNKFGSYFSDEGSNETLKLKRAEQRFAFQYHLAYGYSKSFTVEYSMDNAPAIVKNVDAESFATIRQNRTKNQLRYPSLKPLFAQPPYLNLSVNDKEHVAVLTIKWFQNDVLESVNETFKTFVDSAFVEIKTRKVNDLIIDIRNNGGGESENASYLYSYLTNKPFRFLYAMEVKKKIYADDVKRGIKYKLVNNTGKYQTTDSTTPYQQFFGLGVQQPKRNSFSGSLYILIDGLTTSAAPQFASLVQQKKRGLLIGENAPASLHGGSGRGYSYFLLPNSGLLTMISQYRLYLTPPNKKIIDVGLIPDYKPIKSFGDLLNGADNDMEYTIRLIRETKKNYTNNGENRN